MAVAVCVAVAVAVGVSVGVASMFMNGKPRSSVSQSRYLESLQAFSLSW